MRKLYLGAAVALVGGLMTLGGGPVTAAPAPTSTPPEHCDGEIDLCKPAYLLCVRVDQATKGIVHC